MEDLVNLFSLNHCSKSGAKFDYEKGKWFNHKYIQMKSNEEIAEMFEPILAEKGVSAPKETIVKIVSLTKERVNFVKELWDHASFFFVAPTSYDEKTRKKRWKEDSASLLTQLIEVISGVENFTSHNTEEIVKAWIEENGYHLGTIMNAFRLVLVGEGNGPNIFDITEILGTEETISRLNTAIVAFV